MPDDAALVVAWCRQAKRRGALSGDLCLAQEYAEVIAERADMLREKSKDDSMHEHLDGLFEAWLNIEHNDIWKDMDRQRSAAKQDSPSLDLRTVSDDTMEGLLAKLRAAAL